MEFLFWISVGLVVFAYFGYPAILWVLCQFKFTFYKDNSLPTEDYTPSVSVIITVATETKQMILKKIKNTCELVYPWQWELIIVLDGLNEELYKWIGEQLGTFAGNTAFSVRMLWERGGKEAAQHLAIQGATGEIVVFTDVATTLKKDAILQLVNNFIKYPSVGAVDGMSQTDGDEGLYIRYENAIRYLESQVSTLVTLGGCLFAVRKAIIKDNFATNMQSDFSTALRTIKYGMRSVLDRDAVAQYISIANPDKEKQRKHRTVVRGLNTFFHHLFLLNPFKYRFVSFQLLVHKLFKWLVPFALIVALVSNAYTVELLGNTFYSILFVLHILFYNLAIIGMCNTNLKQPWFRIPGFFLMSNLAILKAWFSYICGERFVMWDASIRHVEEKAS